MPWLMGGRASSSCRPSSLSPLFMGGDIEISTARFISDSSLALPIDSPARWADWMDRVESSYTAEPSDQEE